MINHNIFITCKEKMATTLKVFFHIILLISLYCVVKEVEGEPRTKKEYIKCKFDDDCPKIFLIRVHKCIDNLCTLVRVIPD
uniref:Nodule-specific cysteine-rich peptide G28 n=1 Tax=Pisum sativum TaxID=3888 RepID=A0A7T8DV85_PEA|nr:nodule-specific cysteine-rich peptide G28 [Pisum sativum]